MKTIVFLDLEDTVLKPVLNGWFATEMVAKEKFDLVKELVEKFSPNELSIFSFAIWDEAQRIRFDMGTRKWLEQCLGREFIQVLRVDEDIITACCKNKGLHVDSVDFQEMSNFWGKHDAFRIFIQETFKNRTSNDERIHVVLIDDVVEDEQFFWPRMNVSGQIINIDHALADRKSENANSN